MAEDRDLTPEVRELLGLIRDGLTLPKAADGAYFERGQVQRARAITIAGYLDSLLDGVAPGQLNVALDLMRTLGEDVPITYDTREE